MYLLKLALRSWRLAPLSQVFSAIAVGFLLLLIGFLFWMHQGLKPILVRLQGEQVITAYIQSTVEKKDELKLLDEVHRALVHEGNVDVKMVNASQFLQLLKGQYPDLGRELEDLGQEMVQVIPRYVSVSGILSNSALEKIKNIPGIESAESSKDRYRQIVGAFSALRWVARILMTGVFFALLTGLIHLSRMNVYLHQDALSLLKYWGAGSGTLVTPGIISGLCVGIIGGGIASIGWLTGGNWLTHQVKALSSLLKTMPSVHSHLAIVLFIVGATLGLLAGALGSFSISRLNSRGGYES